MKRVVAVVIAIAFAVGGLSAGGWAQGTTKTDSKSTKPAAPAKAAEPEKKSGGKVDLNTASAADLTGAGFSDAEAKKIIDGRPYKRKDELVKKKIISEDTYKKVKDGIIAHHVKAETTEKKK